MEWCPTRLQSFPPGIESEAKAVNSDLDKGMRPNLDAALIDAKLHDSVKYASRIMS